MRAGHSFSDVAAKCVHIVNLASVREFERVQGRPVDPLRFRANLYIDGVAPWAEFGWLDKELRIGPARLAVFARTSAARPPTSIRRPARATWRSPPRCKRTWGHSDFGIYAKVIDGRRDGRRAHRVVPAGLRRRRHASSRGSQASFSRAGSSLRPELASRRLRCCARRTGRRRNSGCSCACWKRSRRRGSSPPSPACSCGGAPAALRAAPAWGGSRRLPVAISADPDDHRGRRGRCCGRGRGAVLVAVLDRADPAIARSCRRRPRDRRLMLRRGWP